MRATKHISKNTFHCALILALNIQLVTVTFHCDVTQNIFQPHIYEASRLVFLNGTITSSKSRDDSSKWSFSLSRVYLQFFHMLKIS